MGLALIWGHRDQAIGYVDAASALLLSEQDPLAQAVVLSPLVPTLFRVDRVQQAEEAFAAVTDVLGSHPEAIRLFLKDVETSILPAIEQSELANSGIRVYERLLSIPSISGDPEVALPLYARLGRFYARTMQVTPLFELRKRADAAHQVAPNWEAIQDLDLSMARLASHFDPQQAAGAYRLAVDSGLSQSASGPRLLFRGLRGSIALAMEIGRYQDAVDFALIGRGLAFGTPAAREVLVPTSEQRVGRPGDGRDAVESTDDLVEFLVEAGDAMTELGRFDLAWDAFLQAGTLAKGATADWNFQIQLGLARVAARAGDTLGGMRILAKLPDLVGAPPRADNFLRRFPEELLLRGELWGRFGNYLHAERNYEQCVKWVTTIVRRRDIELRCRAGLIGLLQARGDTATAEEQLRQAQAVAFDPARFTWTAPQYSYETSWVGFGLLLPGLQADPRWVESQVDHFLTMTEAVSDTAPVVARRAAYEALKLLAIRRRGQAAVDVSPLRSTLAKLYAESYLSYRELAWLGFVGNALADLGERKLALQTFAELAVRLEAMRDALTFQQEPLVRFRVAFGEQIDSVFESMVRLHLESPNETMEALAAHESNRARSAGDLRRVAVTRDAPEPSRDSRERMRWRLEHAILEGGETVAPAQNLLELLLPPPLGRASQDPSTEVGPPGPPRRRPVPRLSVSELQSHLEPASAIVVYRLTARVSGAWVVSRDAVVWRPLRPLGDVEPLISRLRWALQSPRDADGALVKTMAKDAYLAVLGPLAADLGRKDKITIIPDGPLFGVPFEALVIPDGPRAGSFLIESHQVSYQLSLGLLQQSMAPRVKAGPQRLLLVGDPEPSVETAAVPQGPRDARSRLVAARQEMEDVRRVFGEGLTAMYAGEAARRAVLLGNLGEFTHIHLATHGVVKEQYPWDSYLAFSGRDLTLRDLATIRTNADLVVLSACETARARLLAGEGAWGFVAQFLGSGARNVVASLWRVDDHSTARLMGEFYRAMTPGFSEYGPALRTAKLRLLRTDRWKHPYFWAPFVSYGRLP